MRSLPFFVKNSAVEMYGQQIQICLIGPVERGSSRKDSMPDICAICYTRQGLVEYAGE